MKIRALQAFTIRDAESGNLKSAPYGCVLDVDDTLGAQLIQDNLAEEYTLISPTGSVTLTANSETNDVTQYANAVVAVPEPSGSVTIAENGTVDIRYSTIMDEVNHKPMIVIDYHVSPKCHNPRFCASASELAQKTVGLSRW